MAADYELTLTDYLSIMRRRAPYIIGAFVIVLLGSLFAVIFIPRTYQSTGTIMIQSQEVPDSIVPSQLQVGVDERIHNIKERVLTRESLLNIANKYNLFAGSARFLSSTDLVQNMRDRVQVKLINIDTVQGANFGKATIAFNVSFEDKDARMAYQVTSDLVNLFLNWNVKLQTEGATDTAIFLAQAADKQKQEVDRLNGLITSYREQHSDALPELSSLHMTMIQNDQSQLQDINRRYSELQAQQSGEGDNANSLPALKAKLARLSTIYNDSYPDVKALKLKIAALEQKGGGLGNPGGSKNSAPTTGVTRDTLGSLERQRQILQDRIAQNQASIMKTPGVAQQLDMLVSERDNAQKKYEDIENKLQSAQMAEKLKRENKADRFVLLEPPVMPDKPFKPNPMKMMAMGVFLAIASSGGMLMAMVALDNQVRGASALEHVLGNRPLAVIPYLVLEEEEADRKRKIKIAIIAAIMGLIIIALAIQFMYMPLNYLFWKVLARLMV